MDTSEPKRRGRPRIIRPPAEPKTIGRPRLIGKPPLSARDAHAIEMARFGITPADIATALQISHGAACCIYRGPGRSTAPRYRSSPRDEGRYRGPDTDRPAGCVLKPHLEQSSGGCFASTANTLVEPLAREELADLDRCLRRGLWRSWPSTCV